MSTFRLYIVAAVLVVSPLANISHAQTSTETAVASDKVGFSDDVQATVKKALSDSSKADIYVFQKNGKPTESFKLNSTEIRAAEKNPARLLASEASPVKTCKNPTPTPPPGCVVCSSGDIICSKSFQTSKKNNSEVPTDLELKP